MKVKNKRDKVLAFTYAAYRLTFFAIFEAILIRILLWILGIL